MSKPFEFRGLGIEVMRGEQTYTFFLVILDSLTLFSSLLSPRWSVYKVNFFLVFGINIFWGGLDLSLIHI